MLKICIIEMTASARSSLYQIINKYLQFSDLDQRQIPAISLDSISPNEIKYSESADIVLIGESVSNSHPEIIKSLFLEWPQVKIISYFENQKYLVSKLENLARLGISDVITQDTSALEFIKKVVLLASKQKQANSGKLVLVDTAKGGQGVTTVTASLADQLAAEGQRVLMIDLDSQSQALSRFTQSRPFYNEGLLDLLLGKKSLIKENLDEVIVDSWLDSEINCLTPLSLQEFDQFIKSGKLHNFLSLIEKLAEEYDSIIIDLASSNTELIELLYRLADQVVFMISNDPAAIYASCDRLKIIWSYLTKQQELILLENQLYKKGLNSQYLRQQVTEYLDLEQDLWANLALKFCSQGFLWPASGQSLMTLSTRYNQSVIRALAKDARKPKTENLLLNAWKKLIAQLPNLITWTKPRPAQVPIAVAALPKIQLDQGSDDLTDLEQVFLQQKSSCKNDQKFF